MNTFNRLFCLVLLFAISGCGGILKSEQAPRQTWWLEPLDASVTSTITGLPALSMEVETVPGLNSDRILTLDPDARLNHYSGAYWADDLPELLESLVLRSVRNRSAYSPVTTDALRPSGGCRLEVLVQRFHALLNNEKSTRSVEVSLTGTLHCESGSRTIESSTSLPVSGNRLPDVVAGFQTSLDRVTLQLLGQIDQP